MDQNILASSFSTKLCIAYTLSTSLRVTFAREKLFIYRNVKFQGRKARSWLSSKFNKIGIKIKSRRSLYIGVCVDSSFFSYLIPYYFCHRIDLYRDTDARIDNITNIFEASGFRQPINTNKILGNLTSTFEY